MKKILLTGAEGKLGNIIKYGLKDKYDILGTDLVDCDLRFNSDIEKLFDKMEAQGFIPDVLINNAAIDNPPVLINNAAIDNPSAAGINFMSNLVDILLVNIKAAAEMATRCISLMKKNGGGTIINIGSIMGNIAADWRNYPKGFEKPVGYNLSKSALIQLSRSIAVQYGRDNIRSVCVAFGAVDTGKLDKNFMEKFLKNVPLSRAISKESVLKSIEYAIECPELTGQQILIDGGYTAW